VANFVRYDIAEIEDDSFMSAPASGTFPQHKLRLLAFSLKNGIDYNASDDRLSFKGDAIDVDYLEHTGDILFGSNSHPMSGFVRIRAKISYNVPHAIVNPAHGGVHLDTSEYRAQKLATEGGNNHFHIFVSPNYHTDALYIFTPDVLSVMQRYGADFAYKFYDDEIEIYAPHDVMQQGRYLRDVLLLAVNLVKQIETQAWRYRDERANDYARLHGSLAHRGRRMTPKMTAIVGSSIVSLLFVLGYILWIIYDIFIIE
jgi:hypothetical protein